MLMRDRLQIGGKFNRANSFDTSMGMAFSVKNDEAGDKNQEEESSEVSENSDDEKKKTKKKNHHEHHLEAERQIENQEKDFLKTI